MSDLLGPEIEVTIKATMKVTVHPYNEYSNYIGMPGFPDISDEEVQKINPIELAQRMVKADNEEGIESLGALYNEDWDVGSIEGKVIDG